MAGEFTFVCKFRHDIEMQIHNPQFPLPFRMMPRYLADALEHFKRLRDTEKTEFFTAGPYSDDWVESPTNIVTFRLSHAADAEGNYLTTAQWVEALAEAYSVVDTVHDMFRRKSAYRAATKGQSGWTSDVVKLFKTPNGEFPALVIALEHRHKRALGA